MGKSQAISYAKGYTDNALASLKETIDQGATAAHESRAGEQGMGLPVRSQGSVPETGVSAAERSTRDPGTPLVQSTAEHTDPVELLWKTFWVIVPLFLMVIVPLA